MEENQQTEPPKKGPSWRDIIKGVTKRLDAAARNAGWQPPPDAPPPPVESIANLLGLSDDELRSYYFDVAALHQYCTDVVVGIRIRVGAVKALLDAEGARATIAAHRDESLTNEALRKAAVKTDPNVRAIKLKAGEYTAAKEIHESMRRKHAATLELIGREYWMRNKRRFHNEPWMNKGGDKWPGHESVSRELGAADRGPRTPQDLNKVLRHQQLHPPRGVGDPANSLRNDAPPPRRRRSE